MYWTKVSTISEISPVTRTIKREIMQIIDSPLGLWHNTHWLTIHCVIYLMIKDFTMNCITRLPSYWGKVKYLDFEGWYLHLKTWSVLISFQWSYCATDGKHVPHNITQPQHFLDSRLLISDLAKDTGAFPCWER